MFFLSKRKIITMITIITISFIIITIFINRPKSKNIVLPTVALPIENKVIVLDAGHGFPDNRSVK